MGMMPHGEEPVVDREAEVVSVKLDECAAQVRSLAQRLGKRICLELKPTTQECHSETKYLKQNSTFSQRNFKCSLHCGIPKLESIGVLMKVDVNRVQVTQLNYLNRCSFLEVGKEQYDFNA